MLHAALARPGRARWVTGTLVVYAALMLLAPCRLHGNTVGLLGLVLVFSAGALVGVRGAALAAIWAAGVVTMTIWFSPYPVVRLHVVTGTIAYFTIGLVVGRAVDVIGQQRIDLGNRLEEMSLLLDNIEAQVWYLRDPETYALANSAHAAFLGRDEHELRGASLRDVMPDRGEAEAFIRSNRAAFASGEVVHTQEEVGDHRGDRRILSITRSPKLDEGRRVVYVICSATDVTERHRAEERLRSLSEEYERVFNGTQDALFLVEVVDEGSEFRYIRSNQSYNSATGVLCETLRDMTPAQVFGRETGERIAADYRRCLAAGGPVSYEETLAMPQGERTWHTVLTPVRQDERIRYIVVSSRDVTERKELEERMRYLVFHDPLTGLYNRRYLEQEIRSADRDGNGPLSIVVADLDGLKAVNDSLGHAVGDRLLQESARAIISICRPGDVAARWGGDEFVVLLPATERAEARGIARRLRFGATVNGIGGRTVPLSLSVGCATRRPGGEDLGDTLRRAEARMYLEKLSRGGARGGDSPPGFSAAEMEELKGLRPWDPEAGMQPGGRQEQVDSEVHRDEAGDE